MVDRGVQRVDGLLGDLAEQNRVVVLRVDVDGLVCLCTNEVETLVAELDA